MRNLRVTEDVVRRTPGQQPVTAVAWNPIDGSILFTLGPSDADPLIELRSFDRLGTPDLESSLIASWDAPSPRPELSCDRVISLKYHATEDASFIIFASGDIVKVRHSNDVTHSQIEILGSVDSELVAAAWAPNDGEFVLVTLDHNVLCMQPDGEILASVALSDEDVTIAKHVSVGWGKAETQFMGKRARTLRDPTMPDRIEAGHLSRHDRGQTCVTWRGDGEYFAVSSVTEGKNRRLIRVFTAEGVIDSVSEPVDGLEGSISWRPAGNIISGVQRIGETAQVVFFERNGLRHGQFSLRLEDAGGTWAKDIRLSWNSDSSVLAVSFLDRVQLWTMSNYHYYLKQQIVDPSWNSLNSPLVVAWHPEQPLELSIWSESYGSDQGFRHISLVSCIAGGSTLRPFDYGTVAVIDGCLLRVTPLRKANIPPPLSLHEVYIDSNIKDVAVSNSGTMIATLQETSIAIITFDPTRNKVLPKIDHVVQLPDTKLVSYFQVCFFADKVCAIRKNRASQAIELYETGKNTSLKLYGTPCSVNLAPSLDHTQLFATLGGKIYTIDLDSNRTILITTTPSTAAIVQIEGLKHETELILSLDSKGTLAANEVTLAHDCTSFKLTNTHVLYTSAQSLCFIHIETPQAMCSATSKLNELINGHDERVRLVERGAKVVAVTPSSHAVILQMPRGNLETIYPRMLVLSDVRYHLSQNDYAKAFLTCRAQRIDFNFLHDNAPDKFICDVGEIVDQLGNVQYIDQLLSQLRYEFFKSRLTCRDEDVTVSLYKETLPTAARRPLDNGNGTTLSVERPGKVNKICDAFVKVLETRLSTNLQNMITAHVCKKPPEVEAALELVATLRSTDNTTAEFALEHTCFLVDANQVYDRALGMYDLDLALMAAQQSQKDPREYLPYLQDLRSQEPLQRKFSIDDSLRRYTKAIVHLQKLGIFENVKAYTVKHELYKQALQLYQYQTDKWREILRLNADYLLSINKFKEAAIQFESLDDYANALTSYRSASLWRYALISAAKIPLPAQDIRDIASDMRDSLTEAKDFDSAAIVELDYLNNTEAAVRFLCKALRPDEAIRVSAARGMLEQLRIAINDGLKEAAASLTELLADCKGQVLAQTSRLGELRGLKKQDELRYLAGEREVTGDFDVPDDISIAETDASGASLNPSLFTRYGSSSSTFASGTLASNASRRTSKNRRREERKRARGKKGSVYEEEYLVNSVSRLVVRVNDTQEDVGRVIETLCRQQLWAHARALDSLAVEVSELLESKVAEALSLHSGSINSATPNDFLRGMVESQQALVTAAATMPNIRPLARTWSEMLA